MKASYNHTAEDNPTTLQGGWSTPWELFQWPTQDPPTPARELVMSTNPPGRGMLNKGYNSMRILIKKHLTNCCYQDGQNWHDACKIPPQFQYTFHAWSIGQYPCQKIWPYLTSPRLCYMPWRCLIQPGINWAKVTRSPCRSLWSDVGKSSFA